MGHTIGLQQFWRGLFLWFWVFMKRRNAISRQVRDLAQKAKFPKWPKNYESKGLKPRGASCGETTHASDRIVRINRIDRINWIDGINRIDRINRIDGINRINRTNRIDRINWIDWINRIDRIYRILSDKSISTRFFPSVINIVGWSQKIRLKALLDTHMNNFEAV